MPKQYSSKDIKAMDKEISRLTSKVGLEMGEIFVENYDGVNTYISLKSFHKVIIILSALYYTKLYENLRDDIDKDEELRLARNDIDVQVDKAVLKFIRELNAKGGH